MSHISSRSSSVVITTITHTSILSSSSTISSSRPPSSSFSSSSSRLHPLLLHILSLTFLLFSSLIPSLHAQVTSSTLDCQLTVPASPLLPSGLATPWILSNIQGGTGCNMENALAQTFVQGAILETINGKISVYDPLVIDQGKQPFAKPQTPAVNTNNPIIVAYWIQTMARSIRLIDTGGSLLQANCTFGIPGSTFGKFAHCNTYAFFISANQQVQAGKLIPQLPVKAANGLPCPTTRDFAYLGRESFGTVMTSYLFNPTTKQTAQDTPTNNNLCGAACVKIRSDSSKILNGVMFSLQCLLWVAPDLADETGAQRASALPLNEIQAAAAFGQPNNKLGTMALVPANDTLATVAGEPNLDKLNLVRVGLNQPMVGNLTDISTADYCLSLASIAPARLQADTALLKKYIRVGDSNEASNLYTLVVRRQIELTMKMNCQAVPGFTSPFLPIPATWSPSSTDPLLDAGIVVPSTMMPLRCTNMFIIDTKCSFLLCLLVVGGGIGLGFIFFIALKIVQGYQNGGRSKSAESTRSAIRV